VCVTVFVFFCLIDTKSSFDSHSVLLSSSVCVLDRCEGVESMDAGGQASSRYDGLVSRPAAGNVSVTAETASQSSCPLLTNELQDVQQFITSHAVNGGIVDLLIAYLTELSQRCRLTW